MIESRNQQELILLRKRARRRLVGAVALVSVSTVLLWKVVDSQPQLDIRPERIEVVSLGPQAPASVPAAPPVAAEHPGVPSAEQDLPPVSEPVTTNPEPTRPEDVKLPPPPVVPPVKAEPPKVTVKPDAPAASSRPARDPAAILNGLADFVASLKTVERVEVVPFHNMGKFKWEALGLDYQLGGTEPPTPESIAAVQQAFASRGLETV